MKVCLEFGAAINSPYKIFMALKITEVFENSVYFVP